LLKQLCEYTKTRANVERFILFIVTCVVLILLEKNSFTAVSKNLTGYRSENNFVWHVKIIMYVRRLSAKSFKILLINL